MSLTTLFFYGGGGTSSTVTTAPVLIYLTSGRLAYHIGNNIYQEI